MKKKLKIIAIFLFIFLIILGFNLLLSWNEADVIWNYGFSHSIYKGLIPYKDFNMVLTPFYSYIMSLGFYIFGSNILIFFIENALWLSIFYFLLYKLLKEKAFFVYPLFFFPFAIVSPNYNLCLLFLFTLLVFLEKENKNDYLIGIVLGLSFLTKQSVGAILCLPTVIYIFKDNKKILKRFLGFLIPISLFIIYLIFNNSIREFMNLCIFGLFDFAKKNGSGLTIWSILCLLLLGICIFRIYKNPKNILHYYVLVFCSIFIPLFDFYHLQIAFFAFMIVFLLTNKRKIPLNPKLLCILATLILIVENVICNIDFSKKITYPNSLSHFEYAFVSTSVIETSEEVSQYISKNKDKKILFFTSGCAYFLKIINEIPVDYYDLINYGNWGINGSDKLLNELRKMKNTIVIVDKNLLSFPNQTDKRALKWVIDHGKHLEKIAIFDAYLLE